MCKHLVFYDGECGLCDGVVSFVYKHDKEGLFLFAPLQGETAKDTLIPTPSLDSVVLIEDYGVAPKIHLESQAIFRILWLLGGFYKIPGILFYLPPSLFNWGYRLVARNRKSLISKDSCMLPLRKDRSRFLD